MSEFIANINMLTDSVFPVVTVSGAQRWESLAGLLETKGDAPVAFGWPRADLNIASTELAIGLLCLVYRPVDETEWGALWAGRSDVDLAEAIAGLAPFFNLFGDAQGRGPRFCQDFEALTGEANAVEALFIDTPGVNGQKKNSDLLTHRDRFPALGLKAAAMALYAMQQFAPSGGAGNRTSMRGGGPMTTLALPAGFDGAPVSLRQMLLLNLPVLFGGDGWLEDRDIGRALPWLSPTLTSDGKPPREIAEADPAAHPVQAFFGMPRRIRLLVGEEGICPLSGEKGALVTGFVQKPWGANYSIWEHPLTPYRQTKEEPPYSVKPKAARFSYRDWVGVTVGREEKANKAFPATNIRALRQRTGALHRAGVKSVRLLAAGWAMNNMEAETFLFSVQPLHVPPEGREDLLGALRESAGRYLLAAEAAARLLRGALDAALFGGRAKSTDTGVFEEAADAFYERTELPFHAALADLITGEAVADSDDRRERNWLRTIRTTALALFDGQASELLGGTSDVKLAGRVTDAYAMLSGGLSERSKVAKELGVSQPTETKPAVKRAGAPASTRQPAQGGA